MNSSLKQRALGSLWGMAIGDAMGMPTSFLTPAGIRQHYGMIENFQPPLPGHIYHDGLTAGHITDDTEQSLALARSFIRCGCVDPNDIVKELIEWAQRVQGTYVSPLGPSTERALKRIAAGTAVEEAGREGDTNGAAMRIAPLGILHGIRGSSLDDLLEDVALACLPTHGTDVAIASAAAIAWGIAVCFQASPSVQMVLHAGIQAAERAYMLGHHVVAPSVAKRIGWITEMALHECDASRITQNVYDLIGTGVAAADSVPAAFGVFAAAQGDPRQTILLASNMGGDCDTIAAMAGALAGALKGVMDIPQAWITSVQQENNLDLDKVAQDLIETARTWKLATPQVN